MIPFHFIIITYNWSYLKFLLYWPTR